MTNMILIYKHCVQPGMTASMYGSEASASGVVGLGFNPSMPGDTSYFKNGSDSLTSLVLKSVVLALRVTSWCQGKWISRTGKLTQETPYYN